MRLAATLFESFDGESLPTGEVHALRRDLEQLRFLVENSHDVIVKLDEAGNVLFASQNVQRMLGYEVNEVLNTSVFAKIHPDDMPHVRSRLELSEGSATCRCLTKNGNWLWVETSGRKITNSNGEICRVLVVRDISERKLAEETRMKLETQLRHSQKLEAVGTLASGIAHDFNNILTVIMACTELAGLEAGKPDQVRTYLAQVQKASNRARDLVNQILTFSRRRELDRRPVRIQHIVKEALQLLRPTLPAIEIDTQIDMDAPPVLADPTQIHQLIVNLCMNAAHAMRENAGCLKVALRTCEPDEELRRSIPDLGNGLHMKLTVSDNGHGMDEHVLKRIFEPFFTTKAPGEGTGLGLSVVHSIIKNHEGAITVRSQLNEGTTFDVYFPTLVSESIEVIPGTIAPLRGNGERILMVDDEPAICDSVSEILKRNGYLVTTHTDPFRALREFRLDPGRFDIVVADMAMPGMTGAEFARQVSLVRDDVPVILASGSGMTSSDRIRHLGVRDLVAKPLNPSVLITAIYRAIHVTGRKQVLS
jgi:PAS domain S-box